MKKIISSIIVILTLSLLLCSCSKSEEAKAFAGKVDAIGQISLEAGELIDEAEKAYSLLSAEDKGDVKKELEKLTAIKEKYVKIKEFDDRAKALGVIFDKVFTEYGIARDSFIPEYDALQSEAASADEELKPSYSKSLEELASKHAKYLETEKNAAASAAAFVKGFNEYMKSEGKTATVKSIGCIAQISDGIEYFLFAMTVEEGTAEKNVYSRARFAGTPAEASFTSFADNFYADSPASENTDALKNGNVLIDTAAVLLSVK